MSEKITLSGEQFNLPIKDLKLRPPITLDGKVTLKEAVAVMQDSSIGSILIIDENNNVLGIVTERDLLMKAAGLRDELDSIPISKVMTHHPNCLKESEPIKTAMYFMYKEEYRHIPITDEEGKPVAVMSIKDIVRFIVAQFPKEFITPNIEDDLPDHDF